MFDTHTHTDSSPDSEQTIEQLCLSAIDKGLKAVTITNHTDVQQYSEKSNTNVIIKDIADTERAKKLFGDKIKILLGCELGSFAYDLAQSARLCALADFDVILSSIHGFDMPDGKHVHFSRDNLSAVPMKTLIEYVDEYYNKLTEAAEKGDADVLCHATYPMRYVNGRYGRGVDIGLFESKIKNIFSILMRRGIALEINTANLGTPFNCTSPSIELVNVYKSMGGELITLASDAHSPEKVGNFFPFVAEELKKLGFKKYYYYEKRKPKAVLL